MEKQETTGILAPGQTKRIINLSYNKMISYGYDALDIDNPYFIRIIDPDTGKTILSRGFSEDLTGPQLVEILEREIPSHTGDGPDPLLAQREIIEEDKLKIAASLPF